MYDARQQGMEVCSSQLVLVVGRETAGKTVNMITDKPDNCAEFDPYCVCTPKHRAHI